MIWFDDFLIKNQLIAKYCLIASYGKNFNGKKKNNSSEDLIFHKSDRRRFPRVPARNLISYVSIDKKRIKLNQGMGT